MYVVHILFSNFTHKNKKKFNISVNSSHYNNEYKFREEKLTTSFFVEFPKTKRSKRLDYFETYQEIHTSSPQVEVELFTIPGEAKFAFLGSLNSGGKAAVVNLLRFFGNNNEYRDTQILWYQEYFCPNHGALAITFSLTTRKRWVYGQN